MDRRSSAASAYRHLYKSKRWAALRAWQLVAEPLCVHCLRMGRVVEATVVDHRKPHRGDEGLFFDAENLQSLCEPHHNAGKQKEERAGYSGECDEDGWPVDRRHPANRIGS